jgi:hypothetical protein
MTTGERKGFWYTIGIDERLKNLTPIFVTKGSDPQCQKWGKSDFAGFTGSFPTFCLV